MVASKSAKKVFGVEIVKEAIIDAKNNAKANKINNVEFVCDDASKYMLDLASKKQHIDVVLMDPPRKGSDNIFLNALMILAPSRVVYVSCNPSTLARDLEILNKDYEILNVQPVDMFPFTAHVETVALLRRKKG